VRKVIASRHPKEITYHPVLPRRRWSRSWGVTSNRVVGVLCTCGYSASSELTLAGQV
jgi:hypothetical protein